MAFNPFPKWSWSANKNSEVKRRQSQASDPWDGHNVRRSIDYNPMYLPPYASPAVGGAHFHTHDGNLNG